MRVKKELVTLRRERERKDGKVPEKMAPTSSRVRRRPISAAGLEADSGEDSDEDSAGKPPSQAQ